jgi:tetratricopeptide (TPR) repeat protein
MSPAPAHQKSEWVLLTGLVLLVGIVTAGVHWPVLSAQALSLDDQEFLVDNSLVRTPSWGSVKRFATEILEPTTVRGYYLPLSMISLMLDCGMGGAPENLRPFHRTSLILHVLNTVLVLVLLYQLFGEPIPAAIVSLLFGMHPLTVEPIAWVGERKTLLAAFFALLCLLCYIRQARCGRNSWTIASLAAYILAVLSKPTAAPIPLLLILLDYWPLQRKITARSLAAKVPFFLVAAIFAIVTLVSHGRTAGIINPTESGPARIPLVIGYLTMFYPAKIIWPVNLTSIYALPSPLSISNPIILFALAGTAVLIAALVVSLRRTRALLAGWLFFFVTVFPTLGVVQYSWVAASDKYVYLPALGLLLAMGAGLTQAWRQQSRNKAVVRTGIAAMVVLICGLEALGVRHYLPRWRDTLTHATYLLAQAPQAPAARNHLGQVLAERGQFAEAIPHFREALRLLPGYSEAQYNLGAAFWLSGAYDEAIEQLRPALRANPQNAHGHYALGSCLQARGRLDEAEACFRQTIRLRPDHAAAHNDLGSVLLTEGKSEEADALFRQALQLNPHYSDAHSNLGTLLAREGKLDEAIEHFRLAVADRPDHAKAHYNLGLALEMRGKLTEAIDAYRAAAKANPAYAEAQYAWGVALTRTGNTSEALTRFTEASRLRPDWLAPLNAAAWILATHPDAAIRRPENAIRMAEQAAKLSSHRNPGVLDTLAAAYACSGDYEQAIRTAQDALALVEQPPASPLAVQIQGHLHLYRRGQPCIDSAEPTASSQAQ